MLIKSYGQFWNPQVVNWGAKGKNNKATLRGKVRIDRKIYEIDFWTAKGIYVLYENFKCIYIGKAVDTGLGNRLKSHLTGRMAGRWDMFSFYTTSPIMKTKLTTKYRGKQAVEENDIVSSLEALAILVADPNLNRRRESFKGAYEATQLEEVDYQDESALQVNDLSVRIHDISEQLRNMETILKKLSVPQISK